MSRTMYNMHSTVLLSNLAPAAVVALVAFAAAVPAFHTLRKAKPGRARSAIAYLLGFLAGLLATIALGAALEPLAAQETPIAVVGMIASFVGPFVGLVHAKLAEPPSRRRSRTGGLQYSR